MFNFICFWFYMFNFNLCCFNRFYFNWLHFNRCCFNRFYFNWLNFNRCCFNRFYFNWLHFNRYCFNRCCLSNFNFFRIYCMPSTRFTSECFFTFDCTCNIFNLFYILNFMCSTRHLSNRFRSTID